MTCPKCGPRANIEYEKQDDHDSGWFSWSGECKDCGAELEGQGFEPGYSQIDIEWTVPNGD